MRRIAIIIQDEGTRGVHKILNGTSADILLVYNFLLSHYGGAWRDTEIYHFHKPDVKTLRQILAVAESYDFAFIYFTGHGGRYILGSDFIYLGEKRFSVRELCKTSKRRIVVTDSCRNYVLPEPFSGFAGIGDLATYPANPDFSKTAARLAFDIAINNLPTGYSLLQSCKPGTSSFDYPSGGLFTQMFFKAIWGVAKNNRDFIPARVTSFLQKSPKMKHQYPKLSTSWHWINQELPLVITPHQMELAENLIEQNRRQQMRQAYQSYPSY